MVVKMTVHTGKTGTLCIFNMIRGLDTQIGVTHAAQVDHNMTMKK